MINALRARALRAPLALLGVVGLCLVGAGAPPAHAAADRFTIELRIVEGVKGPNDKQVVDPKLKQFAKDLRSLPFKQVNLVDSHVTAVQDGERVSLEIPPNGGKGKKRFLQVAAHGRQAGGKLRFQLSIDALKFDTLVAVPDGGTIFVAVPKTQGNAMLFAFTARSSR